MQSRRGPIAPLLGPTAFRILIEPFITTDSSTMLRTITTLAALLTLLVSSAGAQTVRFVPSASWPTIQSAVDASVDGDVVDLAAGVYLEQVSVIGKGIVIRGQGSGLTMIDGQSAARCIEADLPPGGHLKLERLALLDGASSGGPTQESDNQGGCLFVADALGALSAGVVELMDCVIDGGRAANGGGLYSGRHHQLLLFQTVIRNCGSGAVYASAVSLPSGFGLLCRGDLTASDCSFENNGPGAAANGAGSGGAIRIEAQAAQGGFLLDAKRCVFRGNAALRGGALSAVSQMGAGGLPGSVKIENCRLIGNGSTAPGSRGAAFELAWTDIWARSSLLARNGCVGTPDLVDGARRLELIHCTVVENAPLGGGTPGIYDLFSYGSFANIRNCIIAKNRATNHFKGLGGSSPPTVVTSLIEGPTVPGAPSLDLGFIDPAGEDYRPITLSPAVDIGTSIYAAGVDLAGLPRNVGVKPDVGCFENQTTGPAPGTNGTVVDLVGQPIDCLLVNSSGGNVRRQIHVTPGSLITVEVIQPPTSPQPANFLIWGRLGVPRPTEVLSVYFAGGQMAFSPQIIAPGNPLLFTLTNSYDPPPISGLVASTPTPWAGSGFALPFPATLTLQGLIETGGGNVRITNAVVVNGY